MHALADAELMEAADACRSRHHIDAAVFLACMADPDLDAAAVPDLPLGRRDRLLLQLRAATFGPRVDLGTTCPECRDAVAISLTAAALTVEPAEEETTTVRLGEARFRLRPVTSRDLAAIAGLHDPAQAHQALACRCLEPIGSADDTPLRLSEESLEIVASHLADLDPQSDIFAMLDCPGCGHSWQATIDIGLVLVHDIETAAQRLAGEIHDIASVYHWSEAEILALPYVRRRLYLERIRS